MVTRPVGVIDGGVGEECIAVAVLCSAWDKREATDWFDGWPRGRLSFCIGKSLQLAVCSHFSRQEGAFVIIKANVLGELPEIKSRCASHL